MEMTQEKYIDFILQRPCFLDKIYENKSSKGEDWLDNYSKCDSYLKKYLYYRFDTSSGIDVDSHEYAMPIYVALSSNIFEEFKFEKEHKHDKYSSPQYEIRIDNGNGYCLRGDTGINAMSAIKQLFEYMTGNKICKPNKYKANDEKFREEYRKLVSFIEKRPEYKEIYDLLNEHIKLCYSIGNFYPLAHIYRGYSLNQHKGKYCCLDGYLNEFDDVMSEWLEEMKYCFTGSLEGTCYQPYADWIEEYKEWDYFVQENCFEPFLENGKPKKFWNVKKDKFIEDFKKYLIDINQALAKRQEMVLKKICKTGNLSWCKNLFD
jgi:hypothetical protein